MPKSIELNVLARYLDGAASVEERAAIEEWIGPRADRRALVAQLDAAWKADVERLAGSPDAGSAWAHLSRELEIGDIEPDTIRGQQRARVLQLMLAERPRWSAMRVGRWAAAVALLAVAGGAAWYAARGGETPRIAAAPAMREYATPRGQRASVRLVDGTEVILNAESRLRVPVAFGGAGVARAVELEGQAFFTVVHDASRPFTVRTARGVTRDIGTRFDIRAYADESADRVAVTEGEVAVRARADSLSPAGDLSVVRGQVATIPAVGRAVLTRDGSVDRMVAWTSGHLELDGVPLADAARQLGRWYDLDVRVTDATLANRRVSGSYGNEPIGDVLTVLTAAVGARYEWRGRTVTIAPAGGAP